MKHITRAGLGFIGGLFALLGATTIYSNTIILGMVSIILGIALFFYGYKG